MKKKESVFKAGEKTNVVRDIAMLRKCSVETVWRDLRIGKLTITTDGLADYIHSPLKVVKHMSVNHLTLPNFAFLSRFSFLGIDNITNNGYASVEFFNRSKTKRLYIGYRADSIYLEWSDRLIYGVLISLYAHVNSSNKTASGSVTICVSDILRQLHLRDTKANRDWINAFFEKMERINTSDFRLTYYDIGYGKYAGKQINEKVFSKILDFRLAGDTIDYFEPPLGIAAVFFGNYFVSLPRDFLKYGRSTSFTVGVRSYLLYRVLVASNEKNYMIPSIKKDTINKVFHRRVTDDFLRNFFHYLVESKVLSKFTVSREKVEFAMDDNFINNNKAKKRSK